MGDYACIQCFRVSFAVIQVTSLATPNPTAAVMCAYV